MPGQLTRSVKKERARRAAELAAKMKEEYLASCIGTVQSVLFETGKAAKSVGHAGNYCQVETAVPGLHNVVRDVRITGAGHGRLFGAVL